MGLSDVSSALGLGLSLAALGNFVISSASSGPELRGADSQ